jgi:hypothetical protein
MSIDELNQKIEESRVRLAAARERRSVLVASRPALAVDNPAQLRDVDAEITGIDAVIDADQLALDELARRLVVAEQDAATARRSAVLAEIEERKARRLELSDQIQACFTDRQRVNELVAEAKENAKALYYCSLETGVDPRVAVEYLHNIVRFDVADLLRTRRDYAPDWMKAR